MSLFLCLQGNTYHYRKAVPALLRSYVGKREIKKSLQTGNKLEARRKALILENYVEKILYLTRSIVMNKSLPSDEKNRLIRDYFNFLLSTDELAHNAEFSFSDLLRSKETQNNEPQDIDFTDCTTFFESIQKQVKDESNSSLEGSLSNRHIDSEMYLAEIIKEHTSMTYETVRSDLSNYYPNIPHHGLLLNEFSLALIDAHKIIAERRKGNTPEIPTKYTEKQDLTPKTTIHIPQEEKPPSVPLKQVITEYIADREATGRWQEKSKQENQATYQNFLDYAGEEITCAEINYHLVSDYRDALRKLPANRKKTKEYRDKSIADILKMDVKNPMSTTTVNKNLNRLSTLLKFAVKLQYMEHNPAEGMEIPIETKDSELRSVFSNKDLQKLFNSNQYQEDSFLHPFMFWMIPLALFTGMRQTEIAQLHLSDIKEENGIWFIDVNDDAPDKKLKNKNASRKIPLHSFISQTLNLPAYAHKLKMTGGKRLFPEIIPGRDGYGQKVSRWFNGHGDGVTKGYKESCGVIASNGQKKDFHSFRHTLINHLKQKQVDAQLLHEFDGHSHGSMTMDRYGKAYSPELMYEKIVSQITFDKKLNLDYLLRSKYVLQQSN